MAVKIGTNWDLVVKVNQDGNMTSTNKNTLLKTTLTTMKELQDIDLRSLVYPAGGHDGA